MTKQLEHSMNKDDLRRYQYKLMFNPDYHVFTIGKRTSKIGNEIVDLGDIDIKIPKSNFREMYGLSKLNKGI